MDPIQQSVVVTGDSTGGQRALSQVENALKSTENTAKSVAGGIATASGRIAGFLSGLVGGTAKVTAGIATSASLAAKGLTAVGAAAGTAVGILTGLPGIIAALAGGIGAFLGEAFQMAGATKQAKAFGDQWDKTRQVLLSPFANVIVKALGDLTVFLKDPAVVKFTQNLAKLFTIAANFGLKAFEGLLNILKSVITALNKGDISGAVSALFNGIRTEIDKLTGGALTWGINLIVSFVNGIIQGANQFLTSALTGIGNIISSFLQGHSPPPKGPLATIDRWGRVLMNLFLTGFRHADFTLLDQATDIIRKRLQTFVDRGDMKQIDLIPKLIGSQAAVAQALDQMHKAGGLTDTIIANVRDKLKDLGPATQDFVVAQLQALDATKKVEEAEKLVAAATERVKAAQEGVEAATNKVKDAQSVLADKQDALKAVQEDQAALQKDQTARAAELIPLQDKIRDENVELLRLTQAQAPEREHLKQLAKDQEQAENDLLAAQKAQEAALATLIPLRQHLADIAAQQFQLEQEIWQAQDALVPLQQKLADAQAGVSQAQAEATASAQAYQDAIAGAQEQLQAELDAQQRILDAIDKKYEAELKGANTALDAAKALYDFQHKANDEQLLAFDREEVRIRKTTQAGSNEQIAALAKLKRARDKYQQGAVAGLEGADLQQKLAQDQVKAVQERIDKEKAGTQARMQDIQKEGQARIASLQKESAIAARANQDRVNAAQKLVESAQKDIDAQQKAIDALQRRSELLNREQQITQHTLDSREQAIKDETQGAIDVAQKRKDSLADESKALQERLDGEKQAIQDRIDADNTELQIRQAGLDKIKASEDKAIQARLDSAQAQVDAQQKVVDAVQKGVDAAQVQLDIAQKGLDAANSQVEAAQKIVDAYNDAAQLAADRVDQEAKIAALLAEERGLLEQQDKKAPKGPKAGAGAGPKGPLKILPPIDTSEDEKKIGDVIGDLVKNIQTLTDPLRDFFTKLFAGDFAGAKAELEKFGEAANKIITNLFGPDVAKAVRLVTDPIGTYLQAVLTLADSLSKGMPIFDSFKTFLTTIGLPPELATALSALGDALTKSLLPVFREITDGIFPKLGGAIGDLLGKLPPLGEVFNGIAVVVGGVLAVAFGIIVGLFGGIVGAVDAVLPALGLIFDGIGTFVVGVGELLGGFIQLIQATIAAITGQGGVTTVTEAFDNMGKGITGIIIGLIDVIVGLVGGLVGLVLGFITGLVTSVTDYFGTLYKDLVGGSIIPDLVNGIVSWFSTLADKISAFAKGIYDDTLGKFVSLATNVLKSVGGFVTDASTKVGSLKDDLLAKANTIYTNVTKFFTDTATDVGTAIAGLLTDAKAKAQELLDNITGKAQELKDGVIAKFNELKDGVIGQTGIIPTMVAAIIAVVGTVAGYFFGERGIITGIVNGVTAEIPQIIALGTNIVKGLVKGVQDSWHFVEDKVKELAQGLPDPIKQALGIHSASTETQSLAGDFTEGFIVGIDLSEQGVLDRLTLFGTNILNSFRDTVLGGLTSSMTAIAQAFSLGLDGVYAAFYNMFWPHPQDVENKDKNLMYLLFLSDDAFFPSLNNAVTLFLFTWFFNTWQPQLDALLERIKGYFNGTFADALNQSAITIGEAMDSGITQGILNGTQGIIDAIVGAVNSAMSAGQQAAQTGSPSKKSEKLIGLPIGQGVGIGIGKAIGFVQKMGANLANAAIGSMSLNATGGLGSLNLASVGGSNNLVSSASQAFGNGAVLSTQGNKSFVAGTVNIYGQNNQSDAQTQEWLGMITK
jgi:hypothetical protein